MCTGLFIGVLSPCVQAAHGLPYGAKQCRAGHDPIACIIKLTGRLNEKPPRCNRHRSWNRVLMSTCGSGRAQKMGLWVNKNRTVGPAVSGLSIVMLCCWAIAQWPGQHSASLVPLDGQEAPYRLVIFLLQIVHDLSNRLDFSAATHPLSCAPNITPTF